MRRFSSPVRFLRRLTGGQIQKHVETNTFEFSMTILVFKTNFNFYFSKRIPSGRSKHR